MSDGPSDTGPGAQLDHLAIVIPARDEAATIGSVLEILNRQIDDTCHVIVVDDHSGDDTPLIAAAQGATVLPLCTGLGAWSAMQAGIRHAVTLGHDQVVTMDADGQHEATAIPLLLAAPGNAEVVIGGCLERGSRARRMAWHFFRLLSGLPVEDLTSGFRLYRGKALSVLVSREATLLDYQDIGLLLLLQANGLRFAEIAVPMQVRAEGRSRIFSSWWRVLSYMATTTLICLAKLYHRIPSK